MDILVVEDDVFLGKAIKRALETLGYAVTWERTGAQGLIRLQSLADGVALIDLGLGDMDGLDVLRSARAAQVTAPVIIMTARDDVTSKVIGLDAGADDYLSKPFHLDELGARVRSAARRIRKHEQHVIDVGSLHLNLLSYDVFVDDQRIDLSAREVTLVKALAERAGRIVHRDILQKLVYGHDVEVSHNALDVLMHSVRRKIGQDRIRTIRRAGYMMPFSTP